MARVSWREELMFSTCSRRVRFIVPPDRVVLGVTFKRSRGGVALVGDDETEVVPLHDLPGTPVKIGRLPNGGIVSAKCCEADGVGAEVLANEVSYSVRPRGWRHVEVHSSGLRIAILGPRGPRNLDIAHSGVVRVLYLCRIRVFCESPLGYVADLSIPGVKF